MSMRNIIKILLVLIVFTNSGLLAQNENPLIRKETFTYSVKDTSKLLMDTYRMESAGIEQPCLVFLFGGGFRRGERDNPGFLTYFHFLVENGFTVISIDYRLGLKEGTRTIPKIKNAVDMAVDDLFDATAYILQNAKALGINPSQIVVNGSSAGAITALNALYEMSTGKNPPSKLPVGFQYAGVIGFSGAIFSTNGDINWVKPVCPVMFFHGDADATVPFNHIAQGSLGLFGSAYIAQKLEQAGSPFWFYSFVNEGHSISGLPRSQFRNEILKFLDQMVIQKQPMIIRTEVKTIGKERPKNDDASDGFFKMTR